MEGDWRLFVVSWEETGSEEYWTWWTGLYTLRVVELGKFGGTIKRVYFVPKGQGLMKHVASCAQEESSWAKVSLAALTVCTQV
jgi:hypothetical protein